MSVTNEGLAQTPTSGRGLRRVTQKSPTGTTVGRRHALLIANHDYDQDNADLKNPMNDVRLVARALRRVGFAEPVIRSNLNVQGIQTALRSFTGRIKPGDQVFFYYSGHGVALREHVHDPYRNYLLGVAFKAQDEIEAVKRGDVFEVGEVVTRLEATKAQTRIIVIDACRDQPFTRSWSRGASGHRGFASVGQEHVGHGTLLAFSARQGERAMDGAPGLDSGPYAFALARRIQNTRDEVRHIFGDVGSEVRKRTNGRQFPDYRDALDGRYFFYRSGPTVAGPSEPPPPKPPVKREPPPPEATPPPPPVAPPASEDEEIMATPRLERVRLKLAQSYSLGKEMNAISVQNINGPANVDLTVEGRATMLRLVSGMRSKIPIDGSTCRWSISEFTGPQEVVLLKDCRAADDLTGTNLVRRNVDGSARHVTSKPTVASFEAKLNVPFYLGGEMTPAVVSNINGRSGTDFKIDDKWIRSTPGTRFASVVDGRSCKLTVSRYIDSTRVRVLKDCRKSSEAFDASVAFGRTDGEPRYVTASPPVERIEAKIQHTLLFGRALTPAALTMINGRSNVDLVVDGKFVRNVPGSRFTLAVDGRSCKFSVSRYLDTQRTMLLKDCRRAPTEFDPGSLLNDAHQEPVYVTAEPAVERITAKLNHSIYLGRELTPATVAMINGQANVDLNVDGKFVRLVPAKSFSTALDGKNCKFRMDKYVDDTQTVLLKRCR